MRYVIIGLNLLQKRLETQLLQFLVITLLFAAGASALDNLLLMNLDLLNRTERFLLGT